MYLWLNHRGAHSLKTRMSKLTTPLGNEQSMEAGEMGIEIADLESEDTESEDSDDDFELESGDPT